MMQYQNGAQPVARMRVNGGQAVPAGMDWSGEINGSQPAPAAPTRPPSGAGTGRTMPGLAGTGGTTSPGGQMGLRNHLPSEVITDPISVEEAYRGSLKAMLLRYVGNYVVATFLVGTQNTVAWEGILYDVGNDYVTIYQEGRDRYIVSDVYSLKFIEFYDTRCREMCHEMLQNGQWQGGPT